MMSNNPEARLAAALAKLQALAEKQQQSLHKLKDQLNLNLEEVDNGRQKSEPSHND